MTTKKKTPEIIAVDLFCGAGGFTRGMIDAGVRVRGGYDSERACFFPYTFNNDASMHVRDVKEVTGTEIKRDFLDHRGGAFSMIFGSPPCQAFSSLNAKTRGVRTENDARASLALEFVRLVEEVKPDFVALENVPNIAKQDVFKEVVARLEKKRYRVKAQVVDAASYGVPQRRKRLILLASRFGEIEFLTPEEFDEPARTVRDAIGDLEPLQAGETSARDPLHKASRLSELNLRRIRALKPGESRRVLPDELKLACQRKKGGERYASTYTRMEPDKVAPTISTEFHILGTGRYGHYEQDRGTTLREGARLQTFPDSYSYSFAPNKESFSDAYTRMEPDKVAPTISTKFFNATCGRFAHPEQDRALSLREGAALQTFERDYRFNKEGDVVKFGETARFIGNAVPPLLAKAIGQSVLKHAEQCKEQR